MANNILRVTIPIKEGHKRIYLVSFGMVFEQPYQKEMYMDQFKLYLFFNLRLKWGNLWHVNCKAY